MSRLIRAFVTLCWVLASAHAAEPLMDRIRSLEPAIGGHPPNIRTQDEFQSVKKRYEDLKSELDRLVAARPGDQDLLFMRGYLQSLGHNFDYPGAWQGSTDDLRSVLNANPAHVPALVELGRLWVNSNPALAPNAEMLFRGAQCHKGNEPLEEAQKGLFFAFYYQGKLREALRQSEYLVQTWPGNEQYRKLNELTRAALARAGDATPPAPGKVAMASCKD
ncbi:MAG: hypothetical protein JNM82_11335 [Rhodocyclaceae bacterium]|nr:hypothetical protein [Rhodocyclaceae bacterium]